MPNWNQVLDELNQCRKNGALDLVRRKYLKQFSDLTGRNTIAYYSGWLQKPSIDSSLNDEDKNGFMTTIHGLDRSKGLDLIIHTPGGSVTAVESLVHYLRNMFSLDIRAIIPQIAMSAGTMLACSCKVIIMGKQSNIGPIDPQFNGIAAHGVVEEFKTALKEIQENPASIPLWRQIVSRYHPTFLGECQKAIEMSADIVKEWLENNMLKDNVNRETIASAIVKFLGDHIETKTHARHFHYEKAKEIGLNVLTLEDDFDDEFQDLVLTIHHAFMHTFSSSPAYKIIENQNSTAFIKLHK